MEYNPGESWDEVNECYPSDIDEEKAFSEFKYGAVFDEEEFEERGKIYFVNLIYLSYSG